jgi:hypothetical protein
MAKVREGQDQDINKQCSSKMLYLQVQNCKSADIFADAEDLSFQHAGTSTWSLYSIS